MHTRALVVHAAEDLRLEDVELPDPGAHDAVVRIGYVGICGSDLHYVASGRVGTSILSEPMVLGHEVTGTVERAAADGSGPAVGTPVFVHPAITCGECRYCVSGRRNLCIHLRYLGSAARTPHTPGAAAERIVVSADRLLPVDGIDPADAALIEPASVAWHAVGRIAALGASVAGARVAVLGAGPIGLLTVAALVTAGAGEILATDLHDRPLERARALGASAVLAADRADELAAWAPDHVLETSGSLALGTAVRVVAPGGTVVAVGHGPRPLELDTPRIVSTESVVTGSSRFSDEPREVIDALRDGSLRVDGIVSHTFSADRFAEAFATAADAATSSKVLVEF
ncbi:MAG: alcohol dehydrogenase catalytic domain-containing protein [Gordonia polyisoprenivorans]|nr:alcohol dehydrogenase catalytic domain-containing protein [Gordonia polyisoprenivorans]